MSDDCPPAAVDTAIVMCGGAGTRMTVAGEKPLLEIGGTPVIEHVVRALEASRIERIIGAVSNRAPITRDVIAEDDRIDVMQTPGNGYVDDLQWVLATLEPVPVLTVAADIPLLTGSLVDTMLARGTSRHGSTTVCVPLERKRSLGVSIDESMLEKEAFDRPVLPTGINIVDPRTDRGRSIVIDDGRVAVNVNTARDAMIAEALR